MLKKRQISKVLGIGVMMTLFATPAFARSIKFEGTGASLWALLIIGIIILLLQLIPASILFFSFIGSATTAIFKKAKRVEKGLILQMTLPVAVKK